MTWPELYDRLARDRRDADAWRGLDARVRVWAWSHLRRFGAEAVEDVVQDTHLLVYARFDEAYGRETFAGFVFNQYRAVRKEVWTQYATPTVPDVPDVPDEGGNPAERLEPDTREALLDCVDGLAEPRRSIVRMRHLDDRPTAEVAGILHMTGGHVRVELHRALVALRDCVSAALWPRSGGGPPV